MRQPSPSEALLRTRLSAFARHLDAARAGNVRAVHQARVATRRLRAALPLLTRGSKRRKLERTVRRITRALGPLRELDVALETLRELGREREIPEPALACLRAAVSDERRVVLSDVARRIEQLNLEKLRRRAAAAVRPPQGNKGERTVLLSAYAAKARRRAARRSERLKAAIERASRMYLPDRLHEIRIAVKKLRYVLEVTRDASGGRAAARSALGAQIALLKRTQDQLGRVHDLEVLIARTRAIQGSPNAPDLKVSGGLDVLVRRLETECRQLHGHYVASRPQLLDLCDRVIAAGRPARASAA